MTESTDPAAGALPPERQLERWTIDEIVESTVRVLVCRPVAPTVERDVSVAGATADDAGGSATRIQDAIMAIESGDPDATWTDETDVYLDRDALASFLAGRREVAGLPEPRPPREGDVFYVFVPAGDGPAGDGQAAGRGAGPIPMGAGSADRPPATEILPGAEVWDVTAAARQSIKRRYVIAAGGLREPDGR